MILLERVKKYEETVGMMLKMELNLKQDIYTNKLIPTGDDGVEILDETAMKARAKQEKKQEKLEKRGINRERSLGAERNELMEQLTRAPVVLHANSELSDYVGGGSGPTDIILSNVTMELGGIVMLDVFLPLFFFSFQCWPN